MQIRGFEKISRERWEKDAEELIKYFNITSKQNHSDEHIELGKSYDDIIIPHRGTKYSAGYDFYSPFSFTLYPKESIKIPTGIKIYMKEDEYVMIVPRSSMGFKHFMRLANTVAIGDKDFYNNPDNEGHYWIKIRNENTEPMFIKKQQAFAQGIFQKYLLADGDEVTDNRVGGLGSTG